MHLLDKSYTLSYPKAIVFDWDNTLVDSWTLIHESLNFTFEKFGKEKWSLAKTKINIHRSIKDTLPELFHDDWKEAVKVYRAYYESIQNRLQPLELAEETLRMAHSKKIPICIVTNKKNHLIHNEIHTLGWKKYFEYIVGSGDLEYDKPSPIGVEFVLNKINKKPDKSIWFVGDSVTDMETAYNSNCVPVFFGEDDYNSDRYKLCRPKVHFQDHKILSDYLK
jgi:phosphoglycolate phosphatase